MAGHAVIAILRSALQVPVATHPAMCAVVKVSALGTMALAAKLDGLEQGDLLAVSQVEKARIIGDMATRTDKAAMVDLDRLVKTFLDSRPGGECRTAAFRMASGATDGGWSSCDLGCHGGHATGAGWADKSHRVKLGIGSGRCPGRERRRARPGHGSPQ